MVAFLCWPEYYTNLLRLNPILLTLYVFVCHVKNYHLKSWTFLLKNTRIRAGQCLGKLGPGLRSHQKLKKFPLGKKTPLPMVKGQIFIKIFFFLKVVHFFLLVMLRTLQILLLTYNLQIAMFLITKKWFKHSLVKLMKFIIKSQCHIIFWTFYIAFSVFFLFISIKTLKVQDRLNP